MCLIVVVAVTFLSALGILEILVADAVAVAPLDVETTSIMTQMATECQLPVSRIQPTMVAGKAAAVLTG